MSAQLWLGINNRDPMTAGGIYEVIVRRGRQCGMAHGVIGAKIHVFSNGLPLYLLAEWQGESASDAAWLQELPSRMLNALRAVVPFTSRDTDLEELR